MKYLHTFFERGIVFLFVLSFGFVSLYVPQITPPKTVEAGAMTGGSTEITQLLNNFELIGVNGFTSISAAADPISAAMETAAFTLDNVLDGIAWSLAKNILSEMTSSILNWVNSGFKGSPAFITDMEGFLLGIADRTFGEYLDELGGPFSFICAPFKLDVQVAVAIIYENQRANAGLTAPPTCTLTGVLSNLENFVDGVDAFTDGDGWEKWFAITSNPAQYTPYGSVLAAQTQAQARLVNARGQELSVAGFGEGFLSSKVCEAIEGAGSSKEKCTITTPGKVINEALTFQTSAGPRSLIEADEINEIISAVFSQLTQKAITGTMGLLGLSGGTGYTYTGVPFTEQISTSGFTSDPERLRELMVESLGIEEDYLALINLYQPQLEAYSLNITNPIERRNSASEASDDALEEFDVVESNVFELEALIDDYDAMGSTTDPEFLQTLSEDYFALPLHSESEVEAAEGLWEILLR